VSTKSPTLWELGKSLSDTFAMVDAVLSENGGEYTPEIAALVDAAEGEWEDKVLRTGFYVDKRIPAELSAIKAETKRLQARSRALTKRREWFKETYLPEALARQGRSEVRSALLTLRVSPGRARVVVETLPEFLDPDFVRIKREVVPDKKALLAVLESGRTVEGVRLEKKPTAKVS
jgi:hypothetical protein